MKTDPDMGTSVIIPVFNGERYLAQTLRSILDQTRPPQEIIVVDDGSSDNTAEVVKEFGSAVICLEHKKNQGISAARNLGVMKASGELLAFLDADDIWLPNKLQRQQECLMAEPSLHAVFTHVRQFYSPDISQEARNKAAIRQEVMPGYTATTLLIRRRQFLDFGFFDCSLRNGEFIDWFNRAREQGIHCRMLDDVLALRRIHDRNNGILKRHEYQGEYLRLIKNSLHRRRREQGID